MNKINVTASGESNQAYSQKTVLALTELANKDKQEEITKSIGFLGRIWGSSINSPNNIAGLGFIIFLLTGIIYTFVCVSKKPDNLSVSIVEFWGIISPLMTLCLGYIFGKSSS